MYTRPRHRNRKSLFCLHPDAVRRFLRTGGDSYSELRKENMACIVKKFGGTSVADVDHIRNAALRVKAEHNLGNEVVVVVSAMSGITSRLVGYVNSIGNLCDSSEYDTVVSSGEQISSGLMALALQDIGVTARSWLSWQIPIETDAAHGKARIRRIVVDGIVKRLGEGEVVVVAGFQGVSPYNRITTLGRGGSDTSAVALAVALGAERCDIYTDVDGVYTCDPRIVASARKLDKITYEEMLEMASLGSKVLQTRSVEMAMNYKVCLQVRSSFDESPGTLVVNEDEVVEKEVISGVAYSRDEAKITLVKVPDRPGVAASIFGPLADANINVDMIVQNVSDDSASTDLTFTVVQDDLDRTKAVLKEHKDELAYAELVSDSNVAKISVIGVGMQSHVGVAQQMFRTLAENSINIQVISTSEIKISVLIEEKFTEQAVRSLHTAYGLDAA
jgi:aspartate kinase